MQRFSTIAFLVGVACVASSIAELNSQTAVNPHAYFNQLSARSDAVYSYSLRDQNELDSHAGGGVSGSITYNPAGDSYPYKQDAAKVTIPSNMGSIPKQVRLPINHTAGSLLLTWDAWWGPEFGGNLGNLLTHKTFQISSPITVAGLWFEVRSRYALGGGIATVDARPYGVLGPNTSLGSYDRIDPMVGSFTISPATWTRYWVLVELFPGSWDRISMWVADERQNPVRLYDRVEMRSAGSLTKFWLEYNSSGSRTGGPLIAYVRNVVALHNVTNPTTLFQRPLSSGTLPPPTTTTPMAPSNLRISN